eukprot:scaffold48344_cov49-Attheya_sp.AAC.6
MRHVTAGFSVLTSIVLSCTLERTSAFQLPIVPSFGTLRSRPREKSATKVWLYVPPYTDGNADSFLDDLVKPQASKPIIRQWKPQRKFIWSRWTGTVFSTTIVPTLALTAVSTILCILTKRKGLVINMPGLGKLWHMHLTIVSFFLAFFLNTAKSFSDTILRSTRTIQGRLNDLNLICASHAMRNTDGTMTPEAQNICSTGLEKRGLVTEDEVDILEKLVPKARFNAILTWIGSTFMRGCESKEPCIRMPANAHFAALGKLCDLRGACGTIGDMLDARCPIAYVHLIQLLVDFFLVMTPFAALEEMGWFSIGGTFLLSLFFSGLMDLAKMLYDPFNNECFGADDDNIEIDTLIQESNNGSFRFATTGHQVPYAARQETKTETLPVKYNE